MVRTEDKVRRLSRICLPQRDLEVQLTPLIGYLLHAYYKPRTALGMGLILLHKTWALFMELII